MATASWRWGIDVPAWQLIVLLGKRRASVAEQDGRWSAVVGRRTFSGDSLDQALRRGFARRERRRSPRSGPRRVAGKRTA